MKKLKDTILTKVNIQESCISPLNQNLLAWSSQGFMHEVHTVCDQRTQPLSIILQREEKISAKVSLGKKNSNGWPQD